MAQTVVRRRQTGLNQEESRGPRYPFRASQFFVQDFAFVWGYAPQCSKCFQIVKPGDVVLWRKGRLYHDGCCQEP